MPETMNKGEVRYIERPVHEISVGAGRLTVYNAEAADTAERLTVVAPDMEAYQPGDVPVILTAIDGVNYNVTYTDIPVVTKTAVAPPAVRGDSAGDGKQTGSYESRTVKELRELAKERGFERYSQLDKEELIEVLRNG